MKKVNWGKFFTWGTLPMSIIGAAAWNWMFKPAGETLWGVLHRTITLGIDDIFIRSYEYTQSSTSTIEFVVISHFIMMAVLTIITTQITIAYTSSRRSTSKDRLEQNNIINKIKPYSYYVTMIGIVIIMISNVTNSISLMYAYKLIQYQEKDIALIRPYISDEQYKTFLAKKVLINTKDEYLSIQEELKEIVHKHYNYTFERSYR